MHIHSSPSRLRETQTTTSQAEAAQCTPSEVPYRCDSGIVEPQVPIAELASVIPGFPD
eukprot:COSAG02_NODE_36239_length_457_cov_0.868715_1_plen_57_part_01